METPNRVVKPQTPLRLVVGAVLIALLVFAFIVVAIFQSGIQITDARMSGTITAKNYAPNAATEDQVTIGKGGQISAERVTGQYTITVVVPMREGGEKTFTVILPDQAMYDGLKVGDSFDVGPYLVPSK